ncbi:cysteine proteinase inhibitor 5-like [Panicum miliaceum]|uniref:Cysteine proteinase inhibitor 5-like n=1 Tax=Panicum miliaceum TaxID=4540 RepID=A0A3L6TL41_PANMI|nr:cysteine proteinase inhibitor 5-like [Panicum miliaceum]
MVLSVLQFTPVNVLSVGGSGLHVQTVVARSRHTVRRSPLAFPLGIALLLGIADVNDLLIRQVGQFAVLVYDMAHRKDLAFVAVGVVRGHTQDAVGGGTNYRLVVARRRRDDDHRGVRLPGVGRAGVARRHLEAPQIQEDRQLAR